MSSQLNINQQYRNMPVNGKCKRCNFKAPIESFLEDDSQLIPVFIQIPSDVQKYILPYLSLFRPKSGSAMQTAKAVRLLTEIRELIATGYVQVERQVARPCPPSLWAQAMEQMIEQAGHLRLPMKNHNYLLQIAYDLANGADAQMEKQVRQNELSGNHPRRDPEPDDGLLPIEREMKKRGMDVPELKGMG